MTKGQRCGGLWRPSCKLIVSITALLFMVAREKGRILCCSFYMLYFLSFLRLLTVPPSHQLTRAALSLSYACISNASALLTLKYLLSWLLWRPRMLISVVLLLPAAATHFPLHFRSCARGEQAHAPLRDSNIQWRTQTITNVFAGIFGGGLTHSQDKEEINSRTVGVVHSGLNSVALWSQPVRFLKQS